MGSKPFATVTAEQVRQLPCVLTRTIPEDYLDIMGHMNVRWYAALFDEGSWGMFNLMGMTEDYYRDNSAGGFALASFTRYLAEVRVHETVSIHARVLGRSPKRIHFMEFMVNDTTGAVAATFEGLGSHADLTIRRTSPYPDFIAEKIDALVTDHAKLTWDAPISGALKP